GFTAPAAEATVEVVLESLVIGCDEAALEGSHQLDAAAGPVGFVAGDEKRGAGLKAEPAVDARVQCGEAPSIGCRHSVASAACTRTPLGSKVLRKPATRGPTPS